MNPKYRESFRAESTMGLKSKRLGFRQIPEATVTLGKLPTSHT